MEPGAPRPPSPLAARGGRGAWRWVNSPRFLGAGAWGAGQPRARAASSSSPCARAGAGLEGARSCGTCSSGSLGSSRATLCSPKPLNEFASVPKSRCGSRGGAGPAASGHVLGSVLAGIALPQTPVGRAQRGEGQAAEHSRKSALRVVELYFPGWNGIWETGEVWVSGPKQLEPSAGPAAFRQGHWEHWFLAAAAPLPLRSLPQLWGSARGSWKGQGGDGKGAVHGWGGECPGSAALQQRVTTQVCSFWWLSGPGRHPHPSIYLHFNSSEAGSSSKQARRLLKIQFHPKR